MTDRRKTRQLRRSPLDVSDQLVRRVITDPKEKDRAHHEMLEDAERVAAEKKAEREARIALADLRERDAHAPKEREENWKPPESVQDFVRSLSLAHPDWPIVHINRLAAVMWDRFQLTRKAIVAGLKRGASLREQAHYKHGWWWPELEPLSPLERGQVVAQVKRVVCS